jgi:cytochrome c-type biogenesis protein CcmH/NrfG
MKREALLMLIAGAVLGGVLTFIGTRQYFLGKMAEAPPTRPPVGGQPVPAAGGPVPGGAPGGAPAFDPNKHTAMVAQIQEELDKDPQNVEYRVMLGNIYYDQGKWDQAVTFYEQAVKLKPGDADVLVDLGVCYRNLKRPDEALAQFEKALKVEPGKKQALFNQVVVYGFDKGDKAKAREVLKELRAKYPDEPAGKQLSEELDKNLEVSK